MLCVLYWILYICYLTTDHQNYYIDIGSYVIYSRENALSNI